MYVLAQGVLVDTLAFFAHLIINIMHSNAIQCMQCKAMRCKAMQSKAMQSKVKTAKQSKCKAKQSNAMQSKAMQSKAMQINVMQIRGCGSIHSVFGFRKFVEGDLDRVDSTSPGIHIIV